MSEFEVISAKRKRLTESGEVPEWYTTQGLLMFERKYAFNGETVRESFWRVANHLGALVPEMEGAKQKFFDLMWSGKLAPSTPVLCNVGTGRGHPVSCSGGFIGDSIDEFYKNHHENAMAPHLTWVLSDLAPIKYQVVVKRMVLSLSLTLR